MVGWAQVHAWVALAWGGVAHPADRWAQVHAWVALAWRTRQTGGQMCRGSLRRLQADELAIGQLHWSAAKYAPLQEWAMVNGIADCALQGLVREVGVSNYGPKQLRKVRRGLSARAAVPRLACGRPAVPVSPRRHPPVVPRHVSWEESL